MSIKIIEAKGYAHLKRFVQFSFDLYKHNNLWIPPLIKDEINVLRPETNPAFEHCETICALAFKTDDLAGRIFGIINKKYNEQRREKIARFGWIDFIDDAAVSRELLNFVENWAKSHGIKKIMGPMGFTTFDRQGILVEGFEEVPTIASTYNFKYYDEYFHLNGYNKLSDYLEYEIQTPSRIPEKIERIAKYVKDRYHLQIVNARSRKELIQFAHQSFQLINKAYDRILGFVPLTPRQINFFIQKYFRVIQPAFTTVIIDKNNEVVGFQISMPSLSKAFKKAKGKLFPFGFYHIKHSINKPSLVDVLLVAVDPKYHNKGVNALLLHDLIKVCIQKKIKSAESNALLEENLKIQEFRKYFDFRQHKKRRLYYKSIG